MGGERGRNEDNLVELECLPNFFRTPEMTQMDGIEGPSEKTNPSTRELLFDLSILLFLVHSMAHGVKKLQRHALCAPLYAFSFPYLAFSVHNKFCRRQFLQSHGAKGVEFGGANPDLCPQTQLEPVIESR